MHSKPIVERKIETSDREIGTYARSPEEWRERYLQGKPIIRETNELDSHRLDEAMLAAFDSSRRFTEFGRKSLILGVCSWLSLKLLQL